MTTARRLDLDSALRAAPERSIGLSLSDPVSARVDALVELLEQHGERTNRKELIAALILDAAPRPQRLAAAIRAYRRALVRDALLHPKQAESPVELAPRKPGPRPRGPYGRRRGARGTI